jgi:large subunit ribosomal protein L15
MRLPKRGFNTPNAKRFAEISLATLQAAADAGHSTITEEGLVEAGLIKNKRDGLRLLGSGELSSKLDVTVTYATKSAREAVEKAGGSVTMTRPEKVKRLRGKEREEAKAAKKK